MKTGVFKEKHFQTLKLGKKFTPNVLKYPSVIRGLIMVQGLSMKNILLTYHKPMFIYFKLNACRVVVRTYVCRL
jgi:hypothetical protein